MSSGEFTPFAGRVTARMYYFFDLNLLGLTPVSCQLCMFGDSAPQWLILFSSDNEFLRLARPCDNSHVHTALPQTEDLPVHFCNAVFNVLQQCATKTRNPDCQCPCFSQAQAP